MQNESIGILEEQNSKGEMVLFVFSTEFGKQKVSAFQSNEDPPLPQLKNGKTYRYKYINSGKYLNLAKRYNGKEKVGWEIEECQQEAKKMSENSDKRGKMIVRQSILKCMGNLLDADLDKVKSRCIEIEKFVYEVE